jgi:hypothetical protein
VNIDLTPPTVTCQSPAPVFYLKQAGTTVSATVADALSGPVASSISAAAPTTMVGAQSVSLTGYDLAGNFTSAACSYSVIYRFGGFLPPIGSGLNAVSAGQSVPVQFSLNGNQGLNILAAGSPSSQQVACASGTAMGPKMPTSPAGSSSLSYNSTSNSYTYVWKTDKAWSGTCRQLQLMLIDGTTHTALFQFN